MDTQAIAFARSRARLYVRTRHPHGLDVEDVENRILKSLYKYGRGKMCGRDGARPSQDGDATAPQWMMKALAEALNAVQDEGRRNLRALCPWQVRNAEPHLEMTAYRNLARDMNDMRSRHSIREDDRRLVRLVLAMLSTEDRRIALDFMELLSWQKVAARRGMSEGSFRRHVLAGFVSRFKEAWRKVS